MANKIKVVICAPPHRENHIAEISLHCDESPPEGFDSTSQPIGEIVVDNGRLEFEIYRNEEDDCRSFNCEEFVDALNEGMRRLTEIYPQFKPKQK
jgi:hypothetical protein